MQVRNSRDCTRIAITHVRRANQARAGACNSTAVRMCAVVLSTARSKKYPCAGQAMHGVSATSSQVHHITCNLCIKKIIIWDADAKHGQSKQKKLCSSIEFPMTHFPTIRPSACWRHHAGLPSDERLCLRVQANCFSSMPRHHGGRCKCQRAHLDQETPLTALPST